MAQCCEHSGPCARQQVAGPRGHRSHRPIAIATGARCQPLGMPLPPTHRILSLLKGNIMATVTTSPNHADPARGSEGAAADASAVAQPVHAATDHVVDAASTAGERIKACMAAARESVDRYIDQACTLSAEGTEAARSAVRIKPLTAVVAALAVGMLIGRLCR